MNKHLYMHRYKYEMDNYGQTVYKSRLNYIHFIKKMF